MKFFLPALLLALLNVLVEGFVYVGILGYPFGAVITYLEIALIVGLLVTGHVKYAGCVYVTILGSALTEVNFLQEQGFVTSSAFLTHPGFQALRVPGASVGWSTLLGLLIFISAIINTKRDLIFLEKIRFIKIFLAFGASLLVFSLFSYLVNTFSSNVFLKDLNSFLIALFSFGLLFLHFSIKQSVGLILGVTIGALLSTATLFHLGVTRLYAGSEVAISVPAHAYIFLIALLVPSVRAPTRVLIFLLVLGLTLESGFLISGKSVISLLLLAFLVFSGYCSQRLNIGLRMVAFAVVIAPILLLDYSAIGAFFIEHGYELAGYKLKQLDFLGNFSALGPTYFFVSSGGNLIAELITVGAMISGIIPEHFPFIGLGFGGQMVDHYHILILSNPDSYPEEAFKAGRFYGLHLAFLKYLQWGGVLGLAYVWVVTVRYILRVRETWLTWALFMSFWIFGLSDKFDTALFAILISSVVSETVGKKTIRQHG